MRSILFSCRIIWLALSLASGRVSSRAAESNPLRIAVAPFFAPVGNEHLRQASRALPELLVVELSHKERFQLVEREKAQAVWNEFNLSASGLASRGTVAKLGHVLACDWVVSGSLVEANGKAFIWTKVIDVRSGVVIDLNASEYNAQDAAKTIASIAAFLERSGTQPKGQQFIAMGPLVDMNPPLAAKREDWSRRISVLIEKHFLDAGFGVVEMAAVGPIFEERRMETTGLIGNPDDRVKLQAAFWLIDGGCEWNEAAPNKLNVGLRIQKVGAQEQTLRLTELADDRMEVAVIAAIKRAMTNESAIAQPAPNAEADLLLARGMELATARTPFQPKKSAAKTGQDYYNQQQAERKQGLENRNATIATWERTLLSDPKNIEAKTWLGLALLSDPDSTKRERGKELLREVSTSQSPRHANRAKFYLENAGRLARAGDDMARPPKRPDDWLSLNQAVAENPNDMEAKCDLGAAMLTLPRASSREQGRKILADVIAGDRQDQAERARKILASPEKSPAVPDKIEPLKPVSKPVVQAPLTLDPETDEERAQREFFQQRFDKFIPIRFEKDGPQLAKLHRLAVKENTFEYHGRFYCGFKFTADKSLDGDFSWMHILSKTQTQKDNFLSDWEWYILPRTGRMTGFQKFSRLSAGSYSMLKQQFPHTETVYTQTLRKDCLEPGKDYAIWFGFKDRDFPDIMFAMTFQSSFGYNAYGILPLR